jgi:hypothetical protein
VKESEGDIKALQVLELEQALAGKRAELDRAAAALAEALAGSSPFAGDALAVGAARQAAQALAGEAVHRARLAGEPGFVTALSAVAGFHGALWSPGRLAADQVRLNGSRPLSKPRCFG